MKKAAFMLIVICIISLTSPTSCGSSLPGRDEYVKVPRITEQEITINEMESVKSKYNINIPEFRDSAPGSAFYAVVIQFDIHHMSGNVTYDEVRVTMDILETDGTKRYQETGNIEIIAPIPESVDRKVDQEVYSKVAVGFVAAVDEITGNIGAERQKRENYARLYRTVTANRPTTTTVYWTFTPFKDEPIFPGTNYLIALIEVRDRTHDFSAKVHTDCTYGVPIFFGLLRDKKSCVSDVRELPLLKSGQPVAGEPPISPKPPEPGEPSRESIEVTFLGKWGSEGDGDGQFLRPWGIGVIWMDGTVYVGDDGQASVQVFSSNGRFLGRLPGTIIGNFLAVDSNGLIYARNYDPGTGRNERIEIFSFGDHELIGSFNLIGPAPRSIDVDIYGENIYVTDISEQKVYRYAPDGTVLAEWGSEGDGDGQFRDPWGIAVDRYQTGRIYVADTGNNRVQVFSPDGEFLNRWGIYGSGDGQFNSPIDVAVDTSNGYVYVLDSNNARVQVFNPEGEFLGKWGAVGRNDGEFLDPYGIVIDGNDNVYVLDSGNYRVQVFRVSFKN